jgi:hypothetical protein
MRDSPFLPVHLGRRQLCPLCREAIGESDETVVIPDFLADDADPMWPFSNALYHRACFLVWEGRKKLVARFNTLARARSSAFGCCWLLAADGTLEPVPVQRHPFHRSMSRARAPLSH